jgi:hypothetical protein
MDADRLCRNATPMAARCLVLDDRHGREVVLAIAKITYSVEPDGRVVFGPQRDVREIDVPWTRARGSSLRYPSDAVDEKPGTDVVVNGTAYPPEPSATAMDVSVRVATARGPLVKVARVYGRRVWYRSAFGVAPGPPAPLAPTPLTYENAFGGVDDTDPAHVLVDPRNPSGTGVARDRRRLVGEPTPCIEDPEAPLTSRAPAPAGFGPIHPWWSPRVERLGTCDDRWQAERAPIRPVDFDPRHASFAPPGLHSEAPLAGDEPFEIAGLRPEGIWRFRLPRYAPRFWSVVRGARAELPTHLDTVLVDANARQIELTFRASAPLPRKAQVFEAIEVGGEGDLPFHAMARGGRGALALWSTTP